MALRPARFAIAAAAGVILAGGLLVQASSSVLMLSQPQLSAQIMPINGLALEQVAAVQFRGGVAEEEDIVPSATAAKTTALRAYGLDPLTPKAHAVAAIAESDPAKKRAILQAASALNRRDLLLQGLILEDAVARQDYAATLGTLDLILRVHPEQQEAFFPVLTEALKQSAAVPALAVILDRSSQWHERFLMFAAKDPAVLPNLARLRLSRDGVDGEVDRRLILGLIEAGNVELATQVYLKARPDGLSAAQGASTLPWQTELPPFDWKLTDDNGFRANVSPDQSQLEVFVRSGRGGILAERLVQMGQAGLSVRFEHSLAPLAEPDNARLQAYCPGNAEPFAEIPLRAGASQYLLPASSCRFVRLAIYARSWSGSPAIRGDIGRLTVTWR